MDRAKITPLLPSICLTWPKCYLGNRNCPNRIYLYRNTLGQPVAPTQQWATQVCLTFQAKHLWQTLVTVLFLRNTPPLISKGLHIRPHTLRCRRLRVYIQEEQALSKVMQELLTIKASNIHTHFIPLNTVNRSREFQRHTCRLILAGQTQLLRLALRHNMLETLLASPASRLWDRTRSFLSGMAMGQGYRRYRLEPLKVNPVSFLGRRLAYQFNPAAGSTSSLSSRPRSAIPSSPRGPPRKPKQSGHALWVGNLPSGTQVIHLKDHFSREATKTIESVFLISKSNCAFVNYRNDEACTAAMTRFHDSRFQGVRLVCRLRRGAAASSPGVPTGPASLTSSTAPSQTAIESIRRNREVSSRAEALANPEASTDDEVSPQKVDRYFIMKSLTAEDIELSIRNSIWATQAHNEEALNKAFNVGSFAAIGIFYADSRQTSKNVYLVFSANKSGEYFGYARMASPIDAEVAASLDWAPKADTVIDDPELPRSFPTPATEWAPKGRIIDDSARGTIFWEADHEDGDTAPTVGDEAEPPKETEAADEDDEAGSQSEAQAFGKPFKIEWIATNRLPFYRTRGLRNPWNANREVKIARDGTELEPGVGRRLLQMFEFHRTAPSPTTVQSTWPAGR